MNAPHSEIERADGRTFLVVRAVGGDLDEAWESVRGRMSLEAVAALGEREGFRIEDVVRLELAGPTGEHAQRWARRRVPAECEVVTRDAASVAIVARVGRRGDSGLTQRKAYALANGKVRVEALELHVAEHCNLRCAHCYNMSPFVAERFLSVDEVATQAARMAATFETDIFKIMGGEPLLHPRITDVLQVLRDAKISPIIRLFTNGLLLHRMDDAFWKALDQLTISVYTSAPVKPELLDDARAKAKAFDVVLNVKPVSQFSRVLRAERQNDDVAVRETYDRCWLRHRCMIVRDGRFYQCTRAAYFDDFMGRVAVDETCAADEDDGIAIDGPDLAARVVAYLNRDRPMLACRYCHGGDGPVEAHVQLRKRDVAAGRLTPLPVLPTAASASAPDDDRGA